MLGTCDKVLEWSHEEYHLQSFYPTRVALEYFKETYSLYLAMEQHFRLVSIKLSSDIFDFLTMRPM